MPYVSAEIINENNTHLECINKYFTACVDIIDKDTAWNFYGFTSTMFDISIKFENKTKSLDFIILADDVENIDTDDMINKLSGGMPFILFNEIYKVVFDNFQHEEIYKLECNARSKTKCNLDIKFIEYYKYNCIETTFVIGIDELVNFVKSIQELYTLYKE